MNPHDYKFISHFLHRFCQSHFKFTVSAKHSCQQLHSLLVKSGTHQSQDVCQDQTPKEPELKRREFIYKFKPIFLSILYFLQAPLESFPQGMIRVFLCYSTGSLVAAHMAATFSQNALIPNFLCLANQSRPTGQTN